MPTGSKSWKERYCGIELKIMGHLKWHMIFGTDVEAEKIVE